MGPGHRGQEMASIIGREVLIARHSSLPSLELTQASMEGMTKTLLLKPFGYQMGSAAWFGGRKDKTMKVSGVD